MINSRDKGARFERQVAEYLREKGYTARRGQQFSGSPDSPDVVSNFPFHIEAKAVEKLNLDKAFQQAVDDYISTLKEGFTLIDITDQLAILAEEHQSKKIQKQMKHTVLTQMRTLERLRNWCFNQQTRKELTLSILKLRKQWKKVKVALQMQLLFESGTFGEFSTKNLK